MSRFIKDRDGWLNLDHVVRFRWDKWSGDYYAELVGEHGNRKIDADLVDDAVGPTYPAAPGTIVLRCWVWNDDGTLKAEAVPHPVVAWKANEHGILTPITPTTTYENNDERWVLLMPAGQCWDLSDDRCEPYENVEHLKRALIEERIKGEEYQNLQAAKQEAAAKKEAEKAD